MCREEKFSSAQALEQSNTQVDCMDAKDGMSVPCTAALLSTPGSKACYNRELYTAQRCESCSRVLVLGVQVSRDAQL